MTSREKYKQAFGVLHASGNYAWEVNRNMEKKKSFRPTRKLMAVCVCAAVILCVGITAYAYGGQILRQTFGWGNNFEIRTQLDENGEPESISILHTDSLTEPVIFENGKMLFVVNGEKTDISRVVSESKAYRYEYDDAEGNTHVWLVGLNSDEIENYGYAEYIQTPDGTWSGGYSARVNTEADGSSSAEWLENAKKELNIPW